MGEAVPFRTLYQDKLIPFVKVSKVLASEVAEEVESDIQLNTPPERHARASAC